jgi:hypothetical protein
MSEVPLYPPRKWSWRIDSDFEFKGEVVMDPTSETRRGARRQECSGTSPIKNSHPPMLFYHVSPNFPRTWETPAFLVQQKRQTQPPQLATRLTREEHP